MIYFCTLFNSIYLTRGLAMYRSLERNCPAFHLYIFAFDNDCYNVLNQLELKHATIISLQEFESDELLRVKPTRTAGEYCWTCTPSTILYCIERYDLSHCTYIDADLLFYDDPARLVEEMDESHAVLITEHRYTPEYDQSETSGKYCVQFTTFKNDTRGLKALRWWKDACLDWCFSRMEDGKFGDQKYLDDWTVRFEGVHELKNLGGGVAPWNVQQYEIENIAGRLIGRERSTGQEFRLVFYHFHDFKYGIKNTFSLGVNYQLDKEVVQCIYRPYVHELNLAKKEILGINPGLQPHEEQHIPWLGPSIRRTFLLNLLGRYENFYKRSYFS